MRGSIMGESVLINNPVVLLGFAIALALSVFSLIKKAHLAVTLIAVLVFTGTMIYALLVGMDLYEAGTVAALFLIVNLVPLWNKKGK